MTNPARSRRRLIGAHRDPEGVRGSGAVRTNPRSNGPSAQADPLLIAAHPSGWRWRGAAAISPSGAAAKNSPTNRPNGSRPDSSLRTIRVPPALRRLPSADHRPGAALRPALSPGPAALLLCVAAPLGVVAPLAMAAWLGVVLPPATPLPKGGGATAAGGRTDRREGAGEEPQGGVMPQQWRARETPNSPDPPTVDNSN
ncbi:hypothetical protein IU442_09015 [Nocardia cyriacigeorgica]|uniref:hypothetical protein n=1 Tax=Nocardia cyriacigeorgica TaxID=135487 RepID=UPI00189607FC|nr:hypothetical protein [Nocardia cyriacigeorgica]MBF6094428.1 hypothetical protein [Nocardia cyriacigeorgica]MBF6401565.1 hypothetical protein [Nocardia cyriacigeorgica]